MYFDDFTENFNTYEDTASQSSYGSHKNRNFETQSHRNSSFDDLRNEKEHDKLALLIMNGNGNGKHHVGKNGGILSKHGGSLTLVDKPQRSVVIDDEDIDAYSPDYGDEEEEEEETEHDDAKMLLDEDEARMR